LIFAGAVGGRAFTVIHRRRYRINRVDAAATLITSASVVDVWIALEVSGQVRCCCCCWTHLNCRVIIFIFIILVVVVVISDVIIAPGRRLVVALSDKFTTSYGCCKMKVQSISD